MLEEVNSYTTPELRQKVLSLLDEVDKQRALASATLAAIRKYAIDKHLEGELCLDGLNNFLSAFDMKPYSRRRKVDFVVRGSVWVDIALDDEDITTDVEECLTVSTAKIDGEYDGVYNISVASIEADESYSGTL